MSNEDTDDADACEGATRVDAHTVRRIAVEAKRAPRTVERWLNGGAGKPTADAAIAEAVQRLGLVVERKWAQGQGAR